MLRELSVHNLALIEDAHVALMPGYCAWTGETGAGKSLLLTALALVLGGKASSSLIRQGCADAQASAVFALRPGAVRLRVEACLGFALDNETLTLARKLLTSGKSQATANGRPVAAATLKQLKSILVDIHGQYEGRDLLDPDHQRTALDDYAGIAQELAAYRTAREGFEVLRKRKRSLIEAAERREREKATIVFELEELTGANPRAGEYDALTQEAHRLANAGAVRDAASEAYKALYEAEKSVQGMLEKVARRLDGVANAAPELKTAAGDLSRIASETRDVAYSLRSLSQSWQSDPARLDEVEHRLALYRRLASRFRSTPDQLEAHQSTLEKRLNSIDKDDRELKSLDRPLLQAWQTLRDAAKRLSLAREKAATAFAEAIQCRLESLSLAEAAFSVVVESAEMPNQPALSDCPGEAGVDHVEFQFTANPGEPPRALHKVASGGELSRVTLAVKAALAAGDEVPTLVFDEIDTGVGGRLGAALGKTLAELAKHHQIICVTHLPQMASFADHQWVIRKQTVRGRTRTSIEALSEADRVKELALMLRGDSAAASTRREALAMLREARVAR